MRFPQLNYAPKKIQGFYIFLFMLVLFTSLYGFYRLKSHDFSMYIESIQHSSQIIVEQTANIVSYGFFQWDQMRHAIATDNIQFYQEQFDKIKELEPKYIETVTIQKEALNFEQMYQIAKQGDALAIRFRIFDELGQNPLEGVYVLAEFNYKKLLNQLDSRHVLKIADRGYPLPFGFNAAASKSLLGIGHYLSAISVALLVVLLMTTFEQQSIRNHYHEDGLYRIISLFERKDSYTANHSRKVALISEFIGKKAGLRGTALRNLTIAALLHDIGKIGVPEHIIDKQDKLTDEEFKIMKKHVNLGAEIFRLYPEISHLSDIVLHHHERIDGSGYPEGLKGDEIPFAARIIAIADVYEALTADRPYHKATSPEQAVRTMASMPLDPMLLEIVKNDFQELEAMLRKKQEEA